MDYVFARLSSVIHLTGAIMERRKLINLLKKSSKFKIL